jgi:hypothetical protein
MKEKLIIKDTEQYKELLDKFQTALINKIPSHEKPSVRFTRDAMIVMQCGPSAVVAELETNSSKVDRYVIYLNNKGEAEFIRLVDIDTGDKV